MAQDAVERPRCCHDPAQAGVRMNVAPIGQGDQQVILRRTGADMDYVPGPVGRIGNLRQARLPGKGEMPRGIAIAHAVSGRGRYRLAIACSRKAQRDKADTIQPRDRVATMKPEWRAQQASCFARNA